jgi:hypothetical protein
VTVEELRIVSELGKLTAERKAQEIDDRRRQRAVMVGWLYPSILSSEIDEISRLPCIEGKP